MGLFDSAVTGLEAIGAAAASATPDLIPGDDPIGRFGQRHRARIDEILEDAPGIVRGPGQFLTPDTGREANIDAALIPVAGPIGKAGGKTIGLFGKLLGKGGKEAAEKIATKAAGRTGRRGASRGASRLSLSTGQKVALAGGGAAILAPNFTGNVLQEGGDRVGSVAGQGLFGLGAGVSEGVAGGVADNIQERPMGSLLFIVAIGVAIWFVFGRGS